MRRPIPQLVVYQGLNNIPGRHLSKASAFSFEMKPARRVPEHTATLDCRLMLWALRDTVTAALGPPRSRKCLASHLKPLSGTNCLPLQASSYNTEIQNFIYQLFENRYVTTNNKTALIFIPFLGIFQYVPIPKSCFQGSRFES